MPALRPFRFLAQADCLSLVPYLQKERPQTIALVLSHLPNAQAAQILVSLSAELQVAVIRRLAELDETDEESVRVVVGELELWLDEQERQHQRRRAGLDAVSGILAAASTMDQQSILKNLRDRDRELARKVNGTQPRSSASPPPQLETEDRMAFDQLAELDKDSLMTIIQRAEPELVVLALAGATAPLVRRVLGELPRKQSAALRQKLDHLGPIRLSDVEAAQQELATLAAQFTNDANTQT
jgi:flagellar motor switch protein FliG